MHQEEQVVPSRRSASHTLSQSPPVFHSRSWTALPLFQLLLKTHEVSSGPIRESWALLLLNNLDMASQVATDVTKALAVVVAGLWVAGCAGTSIVPPELQERIERNISFQQIKVSPLSYLGKIVVVGGTVLSVKPLKQSGTQIEILQLPLTSDDEPYGRLMDSKGRFFAVHKEFLDPATIPIGTRLTVVGEVTGSTTSMVDEFEYAYPTCDILSLTIWPPSLPTYWFRPYPHFGVYWGPYGGSYWGPPQLSPYGWPERR